MLVLSAILAPSTNALREVGTVILGGIDLCNAIRSRKGAVEDSIDLIEISSLS
jgi:hypothetical protein